MGKDRVLCVLPRAQKGDRISDLKTFVWQSPWMVKSSGRPPHDDVSYTGCIPIWVAGRFLPPLEAYKLYHKGQNFPSPSVSLVAKAVSSRQCNNGKQDQSLRRVTHVTRVTETGDACYTSHWDGWRSTKWVEELTKASALSVLCQQFSNACTHLLQHI